MGLWIVLGFGILLLALLREFRLFTLLPAQAKALGVRGNQEDARRLLEQLLVAPSLFGARSKVEIRFRLAWLAMEQGQYKAAAEQCLAILELRLRPAAESNVRQRLADCLEGIGDEEGATMERQRAETLLECAPESAGRLLSQARLLNRKNRYAEACETYERALDMIPGQYRLTRARAMVQFALSCYHAGRPDRTIHWAEAAIASKPSGTLLIEAHGAAGLGYSDLGRMEEAEQHRLQAFELAVAARNRDRAARYLVQLALLQAKRGKIVEAMQSCDRAAGMSLKARRPAYHVQSDCLRAWGRWDEASEMLQRARAAPGLAVPAIERRTQAVMSLGLAWLEADAGHAEAAWNYIQEAVPILTADAKLRLYCLATEARVLAQLARADEARQKLEAAKAEAPQFAQDRSAQLLLYGVLGRAAYLLQDFARGKALLEHYFALNPDPLWQPNGFYFLGECCLGLEDPEGARNAFQKAVDLNIDTYYARLARKRLEQGLAAPTRRSP